MTDIIKRNSEPYIDREADIDTIAWKLASENRIPDPSSVLGLSEKNISQATAYRWLPSITAKYDEFRTIIDEQQKMSLKFGIEASDKLADKFISKDYDRVKDRLYNLTRERFMESWEVDLSKIVPDDQCPIPDPVDPDDDPRVQIWQDMCNPRYDAALDPDYELKKRINVAELSGVDEVFEHFEKLRKEKRDKIYNEFKNVFGPNFH